MIATGYLRIYVPSIQVSGMPPHRGLNVDQPARLNSRFIWAQDVSDDAIYTTWEGVQYACPRNMRLRMLEGVIAMARTNPELTLDGGDREEIETANELAKLRRTATHPRSHVLSSAWHIPLRWFSAFRPSERELYETDGVTSIRYRTSIGEAIDRVRWSINVLDGAGFPEQVVERVSELERWLTDFNADSMVELDYGRTATLFPEGDLVFDESALDIRESLRALEREDFEESGDAYQRVARRWAEPQAYTFVN